jgi:hypothetical protein
MPSAARRTVEERFRLVATLADKLGNHPLVVAREGIRLEVEFDSSGVSTKLTEPDEHLLRSLLVEVRPFLLLRDDCNLAAIHDLAIHHLDDPELVHAIESVEAAYASNRGALGFNLNINGTDLRPETAADLWINGVYFHTDVEKERELAAYVEPASAMVRYFFIDFVIEATKRIVWTGSVLQEAVNRVVIRDEPVEFAPAHPHVAASSPSGPPGAHAPPSRPLAILPS